MFTTITDWNFTENNTCNYSGNIRAEININNVIYRFCYIPTTLPIYVTNFTNNDFKTYFLKNPNSTNVVFYYNGIHFDQIGANNMFKTITDWNFTLNNTCKSNGNLRAEINMNNVIYRFCYIPTTLPTTVTNFTNNDFRTYFLTNPNVSNVVFYYNNINVEQYGASIMFKNISDWNFTVNNTCNSNGNLRAELNMNNVIYRFCYIPTTLPTTVTNFTNNDFRTYFLTNPNGSNVVFYYDNINIDTYGASIMFKNINDWYFTVNNTCNVTDNIRAEININNVIYRFCYIPTTLPTTVTNFTNNYFKTYFLKNPNVSNVIFYYNSVNVDTYGIGINIFNINDWEFTNYCPVTTNKLKLRLEIKINNIIYNFCYKYEITDEFYRNNSNSRAIKTTFLKNIYAEGFTFYYNNDPI
jgi:hypothetical protein